MNTQPFCLERELTLALQNVPSLDLRATDQLERLDDWEKRELAAVLSRLAALLSEPSVKS